MTSLDNGKSISSTSDHVVNPLLALLGPCVRQPGITLRVAPSNALGSSRALATVDEVATFNDRALMTRCLTQVLGADFPRYLHRTSVTTSTHTKEFPSSSGVVQSEVDLPLHQFGSAQTPHHRNQSHIRYPDPKDVASSFYGNRHDAVVAWGYGGVGGGSVSTSSNMEHLLPIAVDRPNGSSAKRYQCITRDQLASFVASIPDPLQRNVYTLVDDVHSCDPYFDIDGDLRTIPKEALDCLCRPLNISDPTDAHATMELILATCLTFLTATLRKYFTRTRASEVQTASRSFEPQETLVLTASSCQQRKLSVHVHMRWASSSVTTTDDNGSVDSIASPIEPCSFQSVMEHKHFADVLEDELKQQLTNATPEKQATAQVLLAVLDLSVYSRWRALRLPYNIKSVDVVNLVQRRDSSAATPKLSVVLSTTDLAMAAILRYSSPGAAATCICVGCVDSCAATQQPAHDGRSLMHLLRPLLPLSRDLDSNSTDLVGGQLINAMKNCACVTLDACSGHDAFAHKCFDLASVTRPSLGPLAARKRLRAVDQVSRVNIASNESDENHDKEAVDGSHEDGTAPHVQVGYDTHQDTGEPHSEVFPAPFPSGRRLPLNTPTVRTLMWRLFQCLHPTAFQNLRPDHLNVVFEDAGQRYWYVYQKHNRYCLHLDRHHQQTCGQLYLTYGSIKFRCYSNDCCRKPCWKRSWGVVELPEPPAPPPQTEEESIAATLREIHGKLFPALDEQQLRLRFPSYLLEPHLHAAAAAASSSGDLQATTATTECVNEGDTKVTVQ
ncbi:Hypothetical protein, putative [Bodo saltans]|uniref:Uncharacterized protein n=1 Tax=Bodo saltans TaxID=75058 RepID=A0A0S4IL49_BODSA|nr:Hypothetical protein, putative [Bodo saltans]|eukprot:CUE70243.1 Hypothetical protein, putative [Bodo saltans]